MPKRICILTSGHFVNDDRLYYKIAQSLLKFGFDLTIISTLQKTNFVSESIKLISVNRPSNKLAEKSYFQNELEAQKPSLIICAEVFTIWPALGYRKNNPDCLILYDVTEWYPEYYKYSKRYSRLIVFPLLNLFSTYVTKQVDGFLFGEQSKKQKYVSLLKTKKYFDLPYYPLLADTHLEPKNADEFNILSSGIYSKQRGLQNLINTFRIIFQMDFPKKVRAIFLGDFESSHDEELFFEFAKQYEENIEYLKRADYKVYKSILHRSDLCIDLRNTNFLFDNSVPIKIFDYMERGKPVIFSDLNSIRNEIEINEFGSLVNPLSYGRVAAEIEKYIRNPELTQKKGLKARELVETKYNWVSLEKEFVNFISNMTAD